MASEAEIEHKFWKALAADRVVMLGLDGVDDGHAQPMSAVRPESAEDAERGPIWFFTTKTNGLVQAMREGSRAIATFASKGHDVFATLAGDLVIERDGAMVDALWNPYVAAWFEGGKADPQLQLIRLDAERAEIWLDEHSLFAGIKLMLGHDPKADYQGKTAEVSLS